MANDADEELTFGQGAIREDDDADDAEGLHARSRDDAGEASKDDASKADAAKDDAAKDDAAKDDAAKGDEVSPGATDSDVPQRDESELEGEPENEASANDSGDGAASRNANVAGDASPKNDGKTSPHPSAAEAQAAIAKARAQLPAQSARSTRFAALGCLGIIAVLGLAAYAVGASILNDLSDPTDGARVEREVEETEEQQPMGEPRPEPQREAPRATRAAVPRTIQWIDDLAGLPENDDVPYAVVFTASYSTDSLDLFEGTLANSEVEAALAAGFVPVHIDLDALDEVVETEPNEQLDENENEDAGVDLHRTNAEHLSQVCELSYLPQLCFVDARRDRNIGSVLRLVDAAEMLQELARARRHFDENAPAETAPSEE